MATRNSDAVELRCEIPQEVADTLDAESIAEGLTRGQMVNRVLGDWHRRRRHALTVLQAVTRINPGDADGGGRGRG